jgi:mxaK protein
MKRAHGHTAFAIVAVALAALAASECLSLQHAQSVNAAVAKWSKATSLDLRAPAARPAPGIARIDPRATAADHLPPEARLARALALAKVDYDGALAAYKSVVQSNRDDLRLMALYDLGNLHLRQAIQQGLADEAQSLPLTELAKQSYRDLLRRDPTDWDARYNLERALRLAPEDDDEADEDTGPPDPREHERSTIADPRMDLP